MTAERIIKIPSIGILQGRLTPSFDGSIQFFPKDNWESEFPVARAIGFDCIELLVKPDSFDTNPIFVPEQFHNISQLACGNGLQIMSVHAFYNKSDEYANVLERIINRSSYLGAKTVLVSFFGDNALVTEEDKNIAREQLSRVLWFCKDRGVRIGIETEMEAPELSKFIKSFKHPSVGIYYDIGNMASMGVDVDEEIIYLGDYICGVHVKDRKSHGGETVPLGEGCADFKGAFRALKHIGYSGSLIIQGARRGGDNDVALNRVYFHFCKDLLDKVYGGK